jgi:type I restriction enzyme M protein
MPNERKTEALVRKRLEKSGFFKDGNLSVEEQKSDSPRIDKLLKNASKKGQFKGYPEFIISSKAYSDFLIVIECKADATKHISKTLDKYSDFAVDGALLYASFLSKEFDVLAIAVSGETEATLRISHYLHLRGADRHVEFLADDILPFDDYYKKYLHSDDKFRQDYDALLNYSRELNEELHAKKIKESHRGLLISGILVALGDAAFKKSFRVQKTAKTLANHLVESIVNELRSADLPLDKISSLKGEFSFIERNTTLTSDKDFFVGLIERIDKNVNTFVRTHKYHDTLGQFYVQFLQYANNDKGLGIVLTPPHIAELFADLAEINKKSVVFDNCCGTAGLLIAAMKRMLVGVSEKEETSIKKKQLIGIEFQEDIYALAVSNMIVHGDGKTNIVSGDCFEQSKGIKSKFKPNVGVLNPPYKSKGSTIEELVFVLNNLSVLQADGKCIAIIPFSCAIGDTGEILELKRKLLEKHTLEAVMSMPAALFHDSNVGVVTCIMVFTAHRPHPSGKKTWFGYWRDDGFITTKHRGRIAPPGKWEEIKKTWLNAYRSREVIKGLSVVKEVKADDEWCPEAYMETDYSTLTQAHFEEVVQNYAVYRLVGALASAEE